MTRRVLRSFLALAAIVALPTSAHADLVLSQLVVDIAPATNTRSDIEIWNNGSDRAYVEAEPREILNPGTPAQIGNADPDPEKLGLLVSPSQMILEPGQRRLLRIAAISPNFDHERVYRVTVKPVLGSLTAEGSALKVLIGYDVLVIVRPTEMRAHVSATRAGSGLVLRNDGNVSVELLDGKQCVQGTEKCVKLPDVRIYSGATTTIQVAPNQRAFYKQKVLGKITPAEF